MSYAGTLLRSVAVCCHIVVCLCQAAYGEPALPDGFVLETYASGLNGPLELEWTPDGTVLFVAEKRGIVRLVKNDALLATPFVDLRAEVNHASDRGLLGIALHPNFPATPWVYMLYVYDPPETIGRTGASGPNGVGQRVSRLIRITADAATDYTTAVAGSEMVVLGTASNWGTIGNPAAPQTDLSAPWSCGSSTAYIDDCVPADGLSHAIGTVAFGTDGMLYVGNGDASTWTTVDQRALRALSPDSLAGKILRIDPSSGLGLSDNPYWNGDPASNRSRVWQLGLRNPFRFRIEPASGALWAGDVGWGTWEELDHGPAGADFGWPCYEGGDGVSLMQPGYAALGECQSYHAANSAVASAYGYLHVAGIGGAIVVGDFYTATKWPLEYRGRLFIADYTFREIDQVTIDGDSVTVAPFGTDILAVDIELGPDGDLYAADIAAGKVQRIVYITPGNSPPSVTIDVPMDGTSFTQGSAVAFSGSATDAEDDDATLTAALSWTSGLDGDIGTGGAFVTNSLSVGTHLIAATATDSGGASTATTITIGISANTPPTATITAPIDTGQWVVGDVVDFIGVATDAEDGVLTGSALVWEAVIIHNTHQHFDYYSATGSSGVFLYPDHDDNTYIRLCLEATDSGGLSASDCVDLNPLEVTYTFTSMPTGLSLSYNSQSAETPFSVLAAAGGGRQIFAPSPQGNYVFQSWSIGGPAAQQITIDSVDQTLAAVYNATPIVSVTAPTNGTSIAAGSALAFAGFATDVEDDDAALSAALDWTSDLDGSIGTGVGFTTDALSIGIHEITASVTDSAGLRGSATITVAVTDGTSWVGVTSYSGDFAASPAPGWSYQWNANSVVGGIGGYQDLNWNGAQYDSDGAGGLPDATELRYGHLSAIGGHSGWGASQGAAVDRYVIAAFAVSDPGDHRIVQSAIAQTGCQWSNGLDLRVYVDANLIRQLAVPAGGLPVDFDGLLGALTTGDRIIVAAGPSMDDGCDGFGWDFAIERRVGGAPDGSGPPIGTKPRDQTPVSDQRTGTMVP